MEDDLPADIVSVGHDGVALRNGLPGDSQSETEENFVNDPKPHTSSLDTLFIDNIQHHIQLILRKHTYARKSAPVSAKKPFWRNILM